MVTPNLCHDYLLLLLHLPSLPAPASPSEYHCIFDFIAQIVILFVRFRATKSAIAIQATKMARVNRPIIGFWAAGSAFRLYEKKKSVMCQKSVMSRSLEAGV
jgi:hypothetical protein